MKSQPKHPWCKKVAAKNLKKGCAEKDVKSKWAARPPLLMEFKFLIMMTRPQNITVAGNSNVLRPGHHYQKFKFHQQQEALAAHFDFTSFSTQPFFRFLATFFLHQGCFGWDYIMLLTTNNYVYS